MLNKSIIIGFGIPDVLKELNIKFCFDNTIQIKGEHANGYNCSPTRTKFCIYNSFDKELIFEMDFAIKDSKNGRAFKSVSINERHVYLQLIRTVSSFRDQKIATYYLQKLKEFCIENNIRIILLNIAPSTFDVKDNLNMDELESFYSKFSSEQIKIKFI